MDRNAVWKALGWDGALPLVAASIPFVLSLAFPRERFVIGLTSEMLPFGVAILRAGVGYSQLAGSDGGKPSIGAQFLLAVAILVLLVFESLAVRLQAGNDAPLIAYVVALALYVSYFLLALVAFKPKAR